LCAAATDTRRREREIVARAVDPVHRVSAGPLEGGDYLPAGEFGLFGVSADRPDGERLVRTSRAAARELLAADAVGHPEVGLVRAPLAADRRSRARHAGGDREAGMEIMHLDTWLNLAGHDLAVGRRPLVEAATVEVFLRDGEGSTSSPSPTRNARSAPTSSRCRIEQCSQSTTRTTTARSTPSKTRRSAGSATPASRSSPTERGSRWRRSGAATAAFTV
jgi:arginine deiminase